jgi:hypothetical protein
MSTVRAASFVLVALVVTACAGPFSFRNTKGMVVEAGDGQPIEGVQVKLDCRKPASSLHGTTTIREVQTISGPDGRFEFAASDVRDCDYMVLSTTKKGFREVLAWSNNPYRGAYDYVPEKVSMLRETADMRMKDLESLYGGSPSEVRPGLGNAWQDYNLENQRFFLSIQIAATPEEIRWVEQRHCPLLMELWAQLGSQERKHFIDVSPEESLVPSREVDSRCRKAP